MLRQLLILIPQRLICFKYIAISTKLVSRTEYHALLIFPDMLFTAYQILTQFLLSIDGGALIDSQDIRFRALVCHYPYPDFFLHFDGRYLICVRLTELMSCQVLNFSPPQWRLHNYAESSLIMFLMQFYLYVDFLVFINRCNLKHGN